MVTSLSTPSSHLSSTLSLHDALPILERVDDEVELRAELRDADDRERAAGSERLQRLADHGQVADRLERVICAAAREVADGRSEEHTSELQSLTNLVCRLLLEQKNNNV